MWTLKCKNNYAPSKLGGFSAICDGYGALKAPVPLPCQPATNCTYGMVNTITSAGNKAAQPNNCPRDVSGKGQLVEGGSCNVKCPVTYDNVGAFTCSLGQVLGDSACVSKDSDLKSTQAIAVASTIQAPLEAGTEPDTSKWAQSFSRALEDVLGTQLARVYVFKPPKASSNRRLAAEAYQIKYEAVVLSTGTVTAQTVAQRASALAQSGSSEQTAFKAKATANGVTVGAITLIYAPRTYQTSVLLDAYGIVQKFDSLPVPVPFTPVGTGVSQTTEEADVGAIIGGIVGGVAGLACISSLCYGWCLMRKRIRES
jgi:hypothetical protein